MKNIRNHNNIGIFFNVSSRSDHRLKISSQKIFDLISKLNFVHKYNYLKDEDELSESKLTDEKLEKLYKTVIKSLHQSDIVILEVSTNSFTQGYILQKSLEMGKPVIALHQRGKYSIFIKGIKNSLLQTIEYDDYSLNESLEEALQFAIENLMTKFNFYLSNDISNYLNWIAKNKNLPKSEFVRALIRDHMSRNTSYLSSLS
jgi:nucleoside 2-deoxyribosyltransferase